ncbi:MAG TPA: phosphoglycerate mutase family protein [Thermoanaerobaculia bacterium]|nr:phosphoglycerate mutase family protein [Thermoanaerobaculia bacterium]
MSWSVSSTPMTNSDKPPEEKKEVVIPTASAVLPNGELVEMVYDPIKRQTQFVCGTEDAWRYEDSVLLSPTERLVPFRASNNLVKHDVVLFPEEPEDYGHEADLVALVRTFIHRYVDVSAEFEEMATYYVLFTWLYDAFSEVPYVRVRGGYGSGKTRFLLTVGSICYKPIFASAASTVSPLFRLLDGFRGTLILDEGDFRVSDAKAEVVKILNNGNARGFPVLRTEVSQKKEFDPRAYHVFGPKLIATRGFFEDKALESRCLTEDMRGGRLRAGIPLNMGDDFRDEARKLRNHLLLYRLRNFARARETLRAAARDLEPRLEQIFGPLLSVIDDAAAQERLIRTLRGYNEDLVDERRQSVEAQVLAVIRDLVEKGPHERLSILDITTEFVARHGSEYEKRASPRWIGSIVRRRLGLRPIRSASGAFALRPEDVAELRALYERYGVNANAAEAATPEEEDQEVPANPS